MPPAKKKSKTSAGAKAKAKAKPTPCEAWQNAVKEEIATRGDESCGYLLIRGVGSEDSDDDDDDEDQEPDPSKYTTADMERVRVIFGTKRRTAAMEAAGELILGDQHGDGFMMFNTSFSYEVTAAAEDFLGRLKKEKDPAKKFDKLLGFTLTAKQHDVWAYDHECGWGSEFGGAAWLQSLARQWKATLKLGDDALGIEPRSRAGVQCLLDQFKDLVENMDIAEEEGIQFKWK